MSLNQVNLLVGMRDQSGQELDRGIALTSSVNAVLSAAGYFALETPVVEQVELFVRKSGGQISGSLYAFNDPGGQKVSLRPEFTPSVIRHYIESSDDQTGVCRWRYAGPVFRYDYDDGRAYRQFTQVGAEIVGDAGQIADAEVLGLVLDCLGAAGLGNAYFTIGHLGLINEVLESFGLPGSIRQFIVGNLARLKGDDDEAVDLRTRAEDSGLVFRDTSSRTAGSYQSQLDREVLMGLFSDTSAAHLGIRAPEEIVDRLMRKVWEAADPESFWAAVQVLVQLGDLTGDPREVLDSAGNLLASVGIQSRVVAEITETFDTLAASAFPFDRTRLDFSFARGIAYYTGLVFEVDVHSADGPITVGGGGRYDGLVRALGGQRDVPALGFAFTVEPMLAASKSATSAATARYAET